MKIAYIATGAAGMMCGTCIHDNTLAAALIKKGHEVALIPTYTPIKTDEENVSIDHIFYGGLNVYLQEKFSFFRKTPAFIDNLLNNRTLLTWLSKFSASTNARDLGAITISMLRGEEGNQRKELLKLLKWLKEDYKPDIVHLNHTLLIGFAREIKRQLGVPVLCGCQGEDLFLDNLVEPYKSRAREIMIERARDIDALIATSEYYAGLMASYLNLNKEKVHKAYPGIKLAGHGDESLRLKRDKVTVIGYFARICPEKGLHLLVEAFHKLLKIFGKNKLQLKIAGYLGKKDENFFADLQKKIAGRGMQNNVEYLGEVDRLTKIVFLNNIDIFSVPTVYKESKGLSILEAMANGVPVVQPNHGLFPEIIKKTGGGILVKPESVAALVDGLTNLIENKDLRKRLGESGKKAVHSQFSDDNMAEQVIKIYENYFK